MYAIRLNSCCRCQYVWIFSQSLSSKSTSWLCDLSGFQHGRPTPHWRFGPGDSLRKALAKSGRLCGGPCAAAAPAPQRAFQPCSGGSTGCSNCGGRSHGGCGWCRWWSWNQRRPGSRETWWAMRSRFKEVPKEILRHGLLWLTWADFTWSVNWFCKFLENLENSFLSNFPVCPIARFAKSSLFFRAKDCTTS